MGRNGCSSKLCPHQIEEKEIESGRDENLIYRQLLALKAKAFSSIIFVDKLFVQAVNYFYLQLILSWMSFAFVCFENGK